MGKSLRDLVKEMALAGVGDLSSFTTYAGTVAPGNLLWVPANCLVVEQVNDASDVFGLRFSMLLARDKTRHSSFVSMANNKMTPSIYVSKAIVRAVEAATKAASGSI